MIHEREQPMSTMIPVEEAQANLKELINKLAPGEEVILTENQQVVGLPDHHKDPFDRILIAQVRTEGLTLVSGDSKFIPYGVPIIW
jgi:PIN domain nuclease of toxin-antitoxin system